LQILLARPGEVLLLERAAPGKISSIRKSGSQVIITLQAQ
jgi:hypothetical protein